MQFQRSIRAQRKSLKNVSVKFTVKSVTKFCLPLALAAIMGCTPPQGSHVGSPAQGSPAKLSFLPPILATTSPSVDRTTMLQLEARAKKENKKIILEIKAAWCGPCNTIAYQIDTHPQVLQDLAKAGYILVKAEYEKLSLPVFALDFLPVGIHFFPSFYLYSEPTGWSEFLVDANPASVVDLVAAVQAHQPTAPEILKAIQSLQAAKGSLSDGSADSGLISSGLDVSPTNESYPELVSVYQTLTKLHVPNSTFMTDDDWNQIEFFANGAITDAMNAGKLPLSQIQKDLPNVAANLLTPSANNAIDAVEGPLFAGALQNVLATQGVTAASNQCGALWQTVRGQLLPGQSPAGTLASTLSTSLDPRAQSVCLTLKGLSLGAQSVTQSSAVSALLSANPTVGEQHEFWGTLALVGLGDLARKNYADRVANSLKNMNDELTDLQKQLQTAQAAGDATATQSAQGAIALKQFQIKYQTQVGQDVDADLAVGHPVPVLEVLN